MASQQATPTEDRAMLQALLHNGHAHFRQSNARDLAAHLSSAPQTLEDAASLRTKYLAALPREAPPLGTFLHIARQPAAQLVDSGRQQSSAGVARAPSPAGDGSSSPGAVSSTARDPRSSPETELESNVLATMSTNGQQTSQPEHHHTQRSVSDPVALVSVVASSPAACVHGTAPQFVRAPPPLLPPLASEATPLLPATTPCLVWDDAAEVAAPSARLCEQLLADAQTRALQPAQHKELLLALVRSLRSFCYCTPA